MAIGLWDLYQHVQQEMKGKVPPGVHLFGYSAKNVIGGFRPDKDGYLFDTPHGYWWNEGYVPPGISQHFPAAIRAAIASATRLVDILTMTKITGEFREAIVQGLEDLADKGNPVSIRILIGNSLFNKVDNIALLGDIRDRLRHKPRCLDVWAAGMALGSSSWNHAKIVAVDADRLITGGHNMWAEDYLHESPIFDISMRYDGPIAKGAHDFANCMWRFVRDRRVGNPQTYSHALNTLLDIVESVPPDQGAKETEPPEGVPAMWVANPGWGVFQNNGQNIIHSTMLIALYKALDTAEHVCISQQALASKRDYAQARGVNYATFTLDGFPDPMITASDPDRNSPMRTHYYHWRLIDGLAAFILRDAGNRLQIVVSPEKARYGNGEPAYQIFDMLGWCLRRRSPNRSKPYWESCLNRQVAIRYPAVCYPDQNGRRYDQWRNTSTPMGNHAKFWMIDRELFYVGSENLYPTTGFAVQGNHRLDVSLQEFGIIAESKRIAADLVDGQYFALMHAFGRPEPAQAKFFKWNE